MIYLHPKFYIPNFIGALSLVIAFKPKAKYRFRAVPTLLAYILQNIINFNNSWIFPEGLVPYIISGRKLNGTNFVPRKLVLPSYCYYRLFIGNCEFGMVSNGVTPVPNVIRIVHQF